MIRRREFITLLGGAVAWPEAGWAQQMSMPVIGFLQGRTAETAVQLVTAFRQGLREQGFVEGQNVAIEYRYADGNFDRLPALAADLAARHVSVIVASYPSGRPAKAATSTIPIVFIGGSDPVLGGLVANINRPDGNITGVSLLAADAETKRLGLLHEVVPQAAIVGALVDRSDPSIYPESDRSQQQLQEAAGRLGVSIRFVTIASERDFDTAFDRLTQERVGGLTVTVSVFFNTHRDRLIAISARHRIPTIYELREFAEAGGLMTYSPSITEINRQAGVYTGRILRGERPSGMPVLLPSKFEFVLNLKTAKALSLTIPPNVFAIADEVIE